VQVLRGNAASAGVIMTRHEPYKCHAVDYLDLREFHPKADFLPLTLSGLRRYSRTIVACVILFLVAGLLFYLSRKPSYSAATGLVLERRDLQLSQTSSTLIGGTITSADVDSQVEILKSWNVAARALQLAAPLSETDFVSTRPWIFRMVGRTGDLTPEQRTQKAISELQKRVRIQRVGDTFTIRITAIFDTPSGAALIASAVTNAFLLDEARARTDAAEASSPWLRNSLSRTGITARVISDAVPPLAPDGPALPVIFVACLMAGIGTGLLIAVARNYLNRRISTPEEALSVMRSEWLGTFPTVHFKKGDTVSAELGRQSPQNRVIQKGVAENWAINPQFAKSLRGVCTAVARKGIELKSLGITSFAHEEGKSTLALSLAQAANSNGIRTLLVDAASNAGLSKKLTPLASAGLVEVLSGKTSLDEAVWVDDETGFHFLPLINQNRYALALHWAKLADCLLTPSKDHDLVIFDLDDVTDTATFVAASEALDGLLFAVECERTGIASARRMLSVAGQAGSRYRGIILNKVGSPKKASELYIEERFGFFPFNSNPVS
jgi:Mrp family chromosome partitioning ATPase/capsular polysaccharide biosynthesis protein